MTHHVPPTFSAYKFTCPLCGVYSMHFWWAYIAASDDERLEKGQIIKDLCMSRCVQCNGNLFWDKRKATIVYPIVSPVALPAEDMPPDVREDYQEAADVLMVSPRAASALLRLALQKLLVHLGQPGKNINSEIAELVRNGLPVQVQQALDALRVIGNESVHPGSLDMRDDVATAARLFDLLNFIVEDRITRPKQIQAIYDRVPESAKAAIDKRDGVPVSAPPTVPVSK